MKRVNRLNIRSVFTAAVSTAVLVLYGFPASAAFCDLSGENYLLNSDFSSKTPFGTAEHWGSAQHAGEPSFDVSFDGGEVTFKKIGPESEMVFKQRLRDTDLARKMMAFTAEIKLDSRAPELSQGFTENSGMFLSATSKSSARPVLRLILEHIPSIGETDWKKVQLVVKFPPKTSNVAIGFLHQAGGVMQVRSPSLRLVDESGGKCKRTRIEK